MTIPELLSNSYYRFNQSLLASELGVNRATLKKYAEDAKGEHHILREIDGEYFLFTKTGGK